MQVLCVAPAFVSIIVPVPHSLPHDESVVLLPALNGLPMPWHVTASLGKAAHAFALVRRNCVVPSHAVPHELSVVESPWTVGFPFAWQPSAVKLVCEMQVLCVAPAFVSIIVPVPHSLPHDESVVLLPALNGLPMPWHVTASLVKSAHAFALVWRNC